jgi:hypothetical protein
VVVNFQWDLLEELVSTPKNGSEQLSRLESELSLISLFAYCFRLHKKDMKNCKRYLVFWIIATSDFFSSVISEDGGSIAISNILRSWEYGSTYCWTTSNIGDEEVELQDPHGKFIKRKQISNYCRDMLLKDYELAHHEKKFDFFLALSQFRLQILEKETMVSDGLVGNKRSNRIQYYVERLDDTLSLLSDRQTLSQFFQWTTSSNWNDSLEIHFPAKERYSAALFSLYSYLTSFFGIEFKTDEPMHAGFKYSNKKAAILNALAFSKIDTSNVESKVSLAVHLWRHMNNKYGGVLSLWVQVEKSTFVASSSVANYCGTMNFSVHQLYNDILNGVHLFSQVMCYYMKGIDDDEFFSEQVFTLGEIQQIVAFLKSIMYKLFWLESPLFDINKSFLQYEDIDQFISTANRSVTYKSDYISPMYGSKPIVASEGRRVEVTNPQISNSAKENSAVLSRIYQLTINLSFVASSTQLFNHLYIRYERRPFSLSVVGESQLMTRKQILEAWVIPLPLSVKDYTPSSESDIDETAFRVKNPQLKMFLTFIPQVLPFRDRVKLFHELVDQDRQTSVAASFLPFHNSLRLSVRRNNLLEDSLNQILPQQRIYSHASPNISNTENVSMDVEETEGPIDINTSNSSRAESESAESFGISPSRRASTNINAALKNRIQIEFISEQGLQEAGIDGGGLFKEFMDALSKDMISEKYGLFQITDEQLVIPHSGANSQRDFEMFEFLGKMLGKALYEVRY